MSQTYLCGGISLFNIHSRLIYFCREKFFFHHMALNTTTSNIAEGVLSLHYPGFHNLISRASVTYKSPLNTYNVLLTRLIYSSLNLPGPLEFAELPSSHTVVALARPSTVARKSQFTNSSHGLPERLPGSRLAPCACWLGTQHSVRVIAGN